MTKKQITFGGVISLSYLELRALLKKTFDIHREHRVRLIDELRSSINIFEKLYRRFRLVRWKFENLLTKLFFDTHYVSAWKK